ncbi:TlpA family protein disulfide reductase [Devosia naphthalenivorans]|uniref:TlpA family protein disulfide reductase n=1 Tax=Devosia naphthalenivorans TaxID=2082392 RepID=UPI0013B06A25|nr:TlpA disulfide reductase family protein [Devosia naphthalenivorans]
MIFMSPSGSSVSTPERSSLDELGFFDVEGNPQTIASFAGQSTLINVWATWCAPCREEMPDLANLQSALGGERFRVATLSIDRAGNDAVRPFLEEIGIRNLEVFLDPTMAVMSAGGVVGLPTTILIDRSGEEIYRWVGPRKWDSAETYAALKLYLQTGATAQLDLPSSD